MINLTTLCGRNSLKFLVAGHLALDPKKDIFEDSGQATGVSHNSGLFIRRKVLPFRQAQNIQPCWPSAVIFAVLRHCGPDLAHPTHVHPAQIPHKMMALFSSLWADM